MKNVICDLHVHSGLKGFGAHGHTEFNQRSIWDEFPERKDVLKKLNFFLKAAIKDVAKESQANLDACAETRLMVPFLAIYPIERQMFEMAPQPPYKNLFNLFLQGKQPVYLGAAVSGFPPEIVERILARFEGDNDEGIDYFERYLEETNYLLDQTKVRSKANSDFSFKIANNYKTFQSLLENGTTITGILTVEGVHSFGHYLRNSTFKKTYDELDVEEKTRLDESFIRNITRVKKEKKGELAPFFVTFCHHFNNLLAGHARSFSGKSDLLSGFAWPNKPGMRHLLNQEKNLKKGFSSLGKQVMELLLDRTEGKRILIDTKHMSLSSRWEYYQYVKQRREQGDHIPIVHSHGAISGWKTLGEAAKHEEDEKVDKNQFFSRWQINLTDEDILETFDSDGIIGLLLHEGRMPGESFKKEANQLKKKIRKQKRDRAKSDRYVVQLKDLYLKLIWSNIFHIVKTIQDERGANGWEIITFGSDFDGLIDPFDSYAKVSGFKNLREDMILYLKSGKEVLISENGTQKTLEGAEVWSLLNGKKPEDRMQQIMFDNAASFMSKYFTDDYLNNSEIKIEKETLV